MPATSASSFQLFDSALAAVVPGPRITLIASLVTVNLHVVIYFVILYRARPKAQPITITRGQDVMYRGDLCRVSNISHITAGPKTITTAVSAQFLKMDIRSAQNKILLS